MLAWLPAATIKTIPFPLTKREFIAGQIWVQEKKKDNQKEVEYVAYFFTDNEKMVDYGTNFKVVNGKSLGIFRAKNIIAEQEGLTQFEVTLLQKLDAGGLLHASIVNTKLSLALSQYKM